MTMPVGVSGPGALSQRTDQPQSVPTGLPYGEAGQLHQAEQTAPMAGTPSVPAATTDAVAAAAGGPGPQPPPLMGAPSQRPDEPVTHGADHGPGADSSILTATPGAPATGGALSQAIAQAAANDPTGTLQQLLVAAQQRGL